MSSLFTVISSTLRNVFTPGDTYQSDDVAAWMEDDEVAIGMVFFGEGKYWRVCNDTGDRLVMRHCNRHGDLLSGGETWPHTETDFLAKPCGKVLLALAHFEAQGKHATIRDVATRVKSSVHGTDHQIRKLVLLGLVAKEPNAHRGARLTESGRFAIARGEQ